MSTDILTAIVSATLVFGFGAVALRELYHRRLAAAALAAAATCAVAHVVFVMVAWKEAASAYLDAHLTMRWGSRWRGHQSRHCLQQHMTLLLGQPSPFWRQASYSQSSSGTVERPLKKKWQNF